jgi:ArsR family transcriptional regulator, arsenate/arsenite/antimonite-responsive transcriptional repressor
MNETLTTIELSPLATGGCCAPATTLRWSMEEAADLAALLKALAHPVRLQIVDVLHRLGGQVCVCDLEAHFDLAQPTISHHLKVLRQAGLIESEQRGVWVYYHTRPAAMQRLRSLTADLATAR